MDYSLFGLTRRPFSPVADPACFADVAGYRTAKDEVQRCLELGRGIAILTAPAGLGKTLLCRRIADELAPRFAVAFLPGVLVSTRRALLQSILHELGRRHHRLDEQELRHQLHTVVRQVREEQHGTVLIVDEAHLLSERLLEELRAMTEIVHQGEPAVRLLLSGQLALEEKLASPGLAALGQRVGCHASLPPLTGKESQQYLSDRLTWAGGRLDELFSPEALRLIITASDGVPRALNQLGEQCLLLAAERGEHRVGEETVRTALRKLQQLPLHWNTSSISHVPGGGGPAQTTERSDSAAEAASEYSEPSDETDAGVVEFGFGDAAPSETRQEPVIEPAPVTARAAPEPQFAAQIGAGAGDDPCACNGFQACLCDGESSGSEEHVSDRYACLDARLSFVDEKPASVRRPATADGTLPELDELRREEARLAVLADRSRASDAQPLRALPVDAALEPGRDESSLVGGESGPDQLIDGILPLIDASLATELSEAPATIPMLQQKVCVNALPDDSVTESDEFETQLGSCVLDSCMATQRAIHERLEHGGSPAQVNRLVPRFRCDSAESPPGRANGSAERIERRSDAPVRLSRSDTRPEPGGRRYGRLFSELRRRLQ